MKNKKNGRLPSIHQVRCVPLPAGFNSNQTEEVDFHGFRNVITISIRIGGFSFNTFISPLPVRLPSQLYSLPPDFTSTFDSGSRISHGDQWRQFAKSLMDKYTV